MFSAIDRTHNTRRWLILYINDAVSEVTTAEVDHINNIEVVVGQHG